SGDFLDLLAAARRDLGWRVHGLQAVQRRAHYVVGIGRAEALGEHVGHAHHLEHGAHRPAGDDAGALVRRLHQYPRRAPAPLHHVVQRAVLQLDLEQLAPRLLHRLLHRDRHFARLALAHADPAVAVAALFVLHPRLDLGHGIPLELQPTGARGIRERLDASVIPVAAAVERDRLDALVLRLGGDALADRLGRLLVAAVLDLRA